MMHPVTAIFVCLFLPFVLWLVISHLVGDTPREMDLAVGNSHERFSFFSIFAAYRKSFLAIFIAGIILTMFSVENNRGSAGAFFGISAWYAILFIVWVNCCYEGYLHFRYSLSRIVIYPGRAYALTITLAVSALLGFLAGLIILLL